MISVGDDYEIDNDQGERVFKLDGKALRIRKTILFRDMDGHELCQRDGTKVAEVSKRWFRIRDSYGVEIAPGENDILILATAAVIDTMAHPGR